jgi:hypothetical protein
LMLTTVGDVDDAEGCCACGMVAPFERNQDRRRLGKEPAR